VTDDELTAESKCWEKLLGAKLCLGEILGFFFFFYL